MKRIFSDYAYGPGPRDGCWWDETCSIPDAPTLTGDQKYDVVIVGGGFTGISAALHLAQAGASVAVLEANQIGWGASGRNGGFCCLGGSRASDQTLDRRFGREGRIAYRRAEVAAVQLAAQLIRTHDIDADCHSRGETVLAHRKKDADALETAAASVEENYGVSPEYLGASDLEPAGLGGPFHGALTTPIGFALNPRKYLAGLAKAAFTDGAVLYGQSAVTSLDRAAAGWTVRTTKGSVLADQVVLATNGYSSEDVPHWLAGRYMPSQSAVLVTRPLSDQEIGDAGWSSDQMAYDTRNLLHYFRLMPDRRFLFGMRGGLTSSAGAEMRSRSRLRHEFDQMFPAWRSVEAEHAWSGFVCLARDMMPFVGVVPKQPGLLAGLCYHGNGVSMGTFSGAVLADLALGNAPQVYPQAMKNPLSRFPLGRARRAILPSIYAGLMLADL